MAPRYQINKDLIGPKLTPKEKANMKKNLRNWKLKWHRDHVRKKIAKLYDEEEN